MKKLTILIIVGMVILATLGVAIAEGVISLGASTDSIDKIKTVNIIANNKTYPSYTAESMLDAGLTDEDSIIFMLVKSNQEMSSKIKEVMNDNIALKEELCVWNKDYKFCEGAV